MTTELTVAKHNTPTADEFGVILTQSQMLVKTGFLPVSIKTPEQALAIILTGRELGIPAMAALNTINVIQGKPTVSPQLMLALIERSGQLEDIVYKLEPDGVTVTMKRRGRTAHTEYFGESEAAAMGLLKKDNYHKQAGVMYKWRAVAACARVVFPDVILGLYTPDEMGATVNADGEVVGLPETEKVPTPAPAPENAAEAAETQKRTGLLAEIAALMHKLNDAGDSIRWDRAVINEFINELMGREVAIKDLTTTDLIHIVEELEIRLDMVKSDVPAPVPTEDQTIPVVEMTIPHTGEDPAKRKAKKAKTVKGEDQDVEVF